MTKEEAKKQLIWYFDNDDGLGADLKTRQAYMKAIEALEQKSQIHRDRTVQDFVDKCRECGKQKKGKWINKSQKSGCGITFIASECTCCGKKTFFNCDELIYRFCPNCGAEMEVKNE